MTEPLEKWLQGQFSSLSPLPLCSREDVQAVIYTRLGPHLQVSSSHSVEGISKLSLGDFVLFGYKRSRGSVPKNKAGSQ